MFSLEKLAQDGLAPRGYVRRVPAFVWRRARGLCALRVPLFVAVFALTLAGQAPTIDQSLAAKQIQGAEISPDGRFIAYGVQQTNSIGKPLVRPVRLEEV